jgi:hypothetical protein
VATYIAPYEEFRELIDKLFVVDLHQVKVRFKTRSLLIKQQLVPNFQGPPHMKHE